MRLAIIIIMFILLAGVQGASAHLTINSTDKFIESDGNKIVLTLVGRTCNIWIDATTINCTTALAQVPDFDVLWGDANYQIYNQTGYPNDNMINSNEKYFMGYAGNTTGIIQQYWETLPYFFGHSQLDESSYHDITLATQQTRYDNAHLNDPDHLVNTNIAPTESSETSQSINASILYHNNTFDIVSWDSWSHGTGSTVWDNVNEWMYASELHAEVMVLDGIPELETWAKPAIGVVPSVYCSGLGYYTLNELRAYSYQNFIYGVKGIIFYPHQNNQTSLCTGFYLNSSRLSYINNMSREFHNNTWLFNQSYSKSWGSTDGFHVNLTDVNFTNNTLKTVNFFGATSYDLYKFSYMLKVINSTTSYLIVVNRANVSTQTTVTITALSSFSGNATTIGLETSGSGASGIKHTVTNGVFSDTVDAFTANVYEISSEAAPPSENATTWTIRGSGGDATWSDYWYEGKP